jgi:RimK family alpha-L-glutamate ligase
MNYKSKGYTPLNESKKAKDIQVVFLSSRAEKTTKSSNSMFFFEDAAKKAGLKMVTIDPSSSVINKGSGDGYNVVENGENKKTFELNPNNTIIVPRRTVLKNIESRDFLTELQNDGFFVLNTLEAIDNCEDKFITYKKLKAAGVPTPKTAVVTSSSMSKLEDKVSAVGGSFPLIIKITKGTQGIGVAQIDSMISLKSVLQAIFALVPKADILVQEKINSDYDLRIHVLYRGFERMTPGIDNFEIIGCMQRNQLAGDFRSNYSLGSTAEKGHLTPDQEKIAKMAAKATGCRWCGVDLIMDSRTKTSYVIEVNSSPGTKGITTAAGDDVVGTLMDMFKDFKYTKYDSDQIGKYETVTFKNLNDGVDAAMKFDDSKTFTELECSSVNATDDDVTFLFNGVTYKAELSGMRKGKPMIELNIKFNGTIYKNELVVLKTVNDNINKNVAVGGNKLLHRISDKAVVVDNSFILTDNTTGFEVPVEKLDESVDYSKIVNINENISLGGLKKVITKFIQGRQYRYDDGNWMIESVSEGKDSWTLSYDGYDILECKENYAYFSNDCLTYENACKVAGIVESFYGHEVDLTPYKKSE